MMITLTMILFLLAFVKISGILDPEQKSIMKCICTERFSFRQSEHWPVGYHGGLDTVGRARPLAGIVPRIFLRWRDFELPGTGCETQGKMLLLYLPPISIWWLCLGFTAKWCGNVVAIFWHRTSFSWLFFGNCVWPTIQDEKSALEWNVSGVCYIWCILSDMWDTSHPPPSIDKHQPIYELLSPNKCQYQPALVWEVMSCWYLRATCYRAGSIPVSS